MLFEMAGLLQYFKLKRQKESLPSPLPDPNGPLSQKVPSSAALPDMAKLVYCLYTAPYYI